MPLTLGEIKGSLNEFFSPGQIGKGKEPGDLLFLKIKTLLPKIEGRSCDRQDCKGRRGRGWGGIFSLWKCQFSVPYHDFCLHLE